MDRLFKPPPLMKDWLLRHSKEKFARVVLGALNYLKMPERACALAATLLSILAHSLVRSRSPSPSLGRLDAVGFGVQKLTLGICASTTVATLGGLKHLITQQLLRLEHFILTSDRANTMGADMHGGSAPDLDVLDMLAGRPHQHADLNPVILRQLLDVKIRASAVGTSVVVPAEC